MLLERAIIQALKAVSPDTLFVLAGRTGTEPNFPYCLVTLVSTKNLAQPDRVMSKEVVNGVEKTVETIIQVKQSVFHLTFVSLAKDEFQDRAEWFHTGLVSDQFIQAFYANGLGIMSASTIVPTIEVENSIGNYMCTTISLTVSFQRIDKFSADRITRVEVEGTDEATDEVFVEVVKEI